MHQKQHIHNKSKRKIEPNRYPMLSFSIFAVFSRWQKSKHGCVVVLMSRFKRLAMVVILKKEGGVVIDDKSYSLLIFFYYVFHFWTRTWQKWEWWLDEADRGVVMWSDKRF